MFYHKHTHTTIIIHHPSISLLGHSHKQAPWGLHGRQNFHEENTNVSVAVYVRVVVAHIDIRRIGDDSDDDDDVDTSSHAIDIRSFTRNTCISIHAYLQSPTYYQYLIQSIRIWQNHTGIQEIILTTAIFTYSSYNVSKRADIQCI